MNQIYVALSSTIIYFLIVFVNDKFIKKNNKKPREYAIDCIYVFMHMYV